jgi:NADPH:quinone reductase-like Zn-dependent oxidoreductase
LEGLSNLIREGRVKPIIEKTYIWKDLAHAHRHVETGKIAGKIGVSMVFNGNIIKPEKRFDWASQV